MYLAHDTKLDRHDARFEDRSWLSKSERFRLVRPLRLAATILWKFGGSSSDAPRAHMKQDGESVETETWTPRRRG